MFLAIGYGELNIQRVLNRVRLKKEEDSSQALGVFMRPRPAVKPSDKEKTQIAGLQGMLYNIAKCCMPVPGESIIGVVTRSRGVMIHRDNCTNLLHVNPDRQIEIQWGDEAEKIVTHAVKLEIHVLDRVGVFKDILTQIADSNTNLSNAKVKVQPDQIAVIEVTVDIENLPHLEKIRNAIERVPDVISVKRHQPKTGQKPTDID
jgi:(p)ppGpp synthase/HD superfamily hydrolase